MLNPLDVLRTYLPHDYTLHGVLKSRMAHDPDKAFITFHGERRSSWSWKRFDAAADGAARAFVARGIAKGDRVAVMGRNGDGHVLVLFALARIGAIMVPVNPEFGAGETAFILKNADVSAVICDAPAFPVATDACRLNGLRPWFGSLDGAIANFPTDVPTLAALITNAPDVPLDCNVSADDTCLIVYTSGTTGFPKGAMHSQQSYILCGEAVVQRMFLQPDERILIVLPLFHINALFYSLAGTLAAGCTAIITPRFSASTFWETAVEVGATAVNIIDVMGTILKARPRTEFRPAHRICKAYGVRANVASTFREEFGIPVLLSGYGMTEIPGVTCPPFAGPEKAGSMGPVGRHPDPQRQWAQCRVVDDDGRDVAVDAVGEMIVKTPVIMQGYFRDPAQTAAAFRDGWFLTGDLVRRDADGWYTFISRKKDIIRRRGENIAGAELDRVIGENPNVQAVAAIPVPAELGEDEILVAIVRKPGATIKAREVADWCRARLSPMKIPRYVIFLDALPYTPTHKVAKMVLRADATLKARAVDLNASE